MTDLEKFNFIVSRPGIRKDYIETKHTQTIEYWINAYRVACKFKQFTHGRLVHIDTFVYPETVKEAQANGLLPAFPNT